MRPIRHMLMRKQLETIRASVTEPPQWWQTWVILELLGFLEGGLTLKIDKLGQFGLIWPTIWQWWQVGANSEFLFNLRGVLDISLET